MKKCFFALMYMAAALSGTYGQQADSIPEEISVQIEDLVEVLSDQYEESMDPTDLLIGLEQQNGQKVDLNAQDPFGLYRLLRLTPDQVQHLSAYIQQHGPLLSVYELQVISGFDSATIRRIVPGIQLVQPDQGPGFHPVPWKNHWSGSVMLRYGRILESQAGYDREKDSAGTMDSYLGDPSRVWVRLNARTGDRILTGLTAEKDPGEQCFKGGQKQGFDHYSAYLMVRVSKILKSVIIGDYHIGFGQGLTLNTAGLVTMGKGLYQPYKFTSPVRPNTSSNEACGLRGAALSLKTGSIEWTFFSSLKTMDARLMENDTNHVGIPLVESLVNTGYHRTIKEMENRDRIRYLLYGGHVTYRNHFLQVGLTCYHTRYRAVFVPSEEVYRRFSQITKKSTCLGFDFRALLPHVMVFGEFTVSQSLHPGLVLGLWWYSHARFKHSLVYRYYPLTFLSPHGSAAGKNQYNNNESGINMAIEALISKTLRISAGAEVYWIPWISYRLDKPSAGSSFYLITEYKPGLNTRMIMKYQYRQTEQNETNSPERIPLTGETSSQHVALQCIFTPLPMLTLKNQVYINRMHLNNGGRMNGYLVSLDLQYRPLKGRWEILLRYALFDTDGYSARIYAYEQDVLYAFSAPAYYSKGIRIMGMLRYEFFRRMDLWIRYSLSLYSDQYTVGSGNDQISSPHKSEIKVQVRYRF